jgi:hypothetical protein
MAASNTTMGNFTFALQAALGAYSDETYTNAKKLSGTGIVGGSAQIDPSTETYIGQARFFKPYSSQTVNVASLSSATDGSKQSYTSDYLTYVKTVRTHGAQEINMQRVVSQQDGLAKIARDFGEVRAQDEHDAILSVLKGVAGAESKIASDNGTGGIADFGQDYSATTTGFYVDINAAGAYGTAADSETNARDLIIGGSTSTGYGAVLGENLFKAVSLGFADYEPDYLYMVTSPEILTKLRVANLVDQTTVTEGNLEFSTIFGGKFRLIVTRADQGNRAADSDVNALSTKTTFLCKPGAIEMAQLNVPMPVELYRDANKYNGGGTTDIWYRWGYVAHPMGYSVASGAQNAFASNATLATNTTFERKFDMLNLGILPVFHS